MRKNEDVVVLDSLDGCLSNQRNGPRIEENKENHHSNNATTPHGVDSTDHISKKLIDMTLSQRSQLPSHLIQGKSVMDPQQSTYLLNQSYSQHSVISSASHSTTSHNPLLDRQIKEINKQKDFLMKLQRDKEELERQMKENERVMIARMQKIQEERNLMEMRLYKAAIVIQRHARGMVARIAYKRY